jgi:hypothetical protein
VQMTLRAGGERIATSMTGMPLVVAGPSDQELRRKFAGGAVYAAQIAEVLRRDDRPFAREGGRQPGSMKLALVVPLSGSSPLLRPYLAVRHPYRIARLNTLTIATDIAANNRCPLSSPSVHVLPPRDDIADGSHPGALMDAGADRRGDLRKPMPIGNASARVPRLSLGHHR